MNNKNDRKVQVRTEMVELLYQSCARTNGSDDVLACAYLIIFLSAPFFIWFSAEPFDGVFFPLSALALALGHAFILATKVSLATKLRRLGLSFK